jgi:hypothetical protein
LNSSFQLEEVCARDNKTEEKKRRTKEILFI